MSDKTDVIGMLNNFGYPADVLGGITAALTSGDGKDRFNSSELRAVLSKAKIKDSDIKEIVDEIFSESLKIVDDIILEKGKAAKQSFSRYLKEMNEDRQQFTIYQIDLNDIADAINKLGSWDKAAAQYPQVEAHLAVTLRGSDNWESRFFRSYDKVATVESESLEKVFAFMNGIGNDSSYISEEPHHSLSVGDIVESNNEYFMVNSMGFGKIEI